MGDQLRRLQAWDSGRHPSLVDSVIQTFCGRVAEAEQRVKILACNDARERLARLLLHLARPKTLVGTQQREEAVLAGDALGFSLRWPRSAVRTSVF